MHRRSATSKARPLHDEAQLLSALSSDELSTSFWNTNLSKLLPELHLMIYEPVYPNFRLDYTTTRDSIYLPPVLTVCIAITNEALQPWITRLFRILMEEHEKCEWVTEEMEVMEEGVYKWSWQLWRAKQTLEAFQEQLEEHEEIVGGEIRRWEAMGFRVKRLAA